MTLSTFIVTEYGFATGTVTTSAINLTNLQGCTRYKNYRFYFGNMQGV
jgi:hypothetical protein